MGELIIEKGIVIDDVEVVVQEIEKLSGKKIKSALTIKKFIQNEKATKFYLNNKCSCTMQPEKDTVYLWLDSGYTDAYGKPIIISMFKVQGEYVGHYVGTFSVLANGMKRYFPKNSRCINQNLASFKNKYKNKISERTNQHIDVEDEYLLTVCNGVEDVPRMKSLLEGIELTYVEELPNEEDELEDVVIEEATYEMRPTEKEITFSLLFETIDGMQSYINELLAEIEKFNSQDRVRIQQLEEKNEEYKQALVQMRTFLEAESKVDDEEKENEGFGGHEILGRNGKILVLGDTALNKNTMNGIAALYGFEKKDIVYETDYTKVVNFAGRLMNAERYAAIIFGACPHKVAGLGDWSSIIQKCHQSEGMPVAFDARSCSGELKVTKESFRTALMDVYNELKMKRESEESNYGANLFYYYRNEASLRTGIL